MNTEKLAVALKETFRRQVESSGECAGARTHFVGDCIVSTAERGQWLWFRAESRHGGKEWARSTDRGGGDDHDAVSVGHWIGLARTAPEFVSDVEQLDRWTLYWSEFLA